MIPFYCEVNWLFFWAMIIKYTNTNIDKIITLIKHVNYVNFLAKNYLIKIFYSFREHNEC